MKLGIYKYFKWWLYEVIWIAKHSETWEDLVVYKSLYENTQSWLWVRPLSMFLEKIKHNDELIYRFSYIWNESYKNM